MVVKEKEKNDVEDAEMEDVSSNVKEETNSEENPQEEVEEGGEQENEEKQEANHSSTTSSSGSLSSKKRKVAEEEGNQEPEEVKTQPQKKAKGKPGRKKGAALSKDKKANVVEKHDEEQLLELEKRIEALEPEIQGLLGKQCWCRMQGYPFWPGVVIDPRKMPPGKMRKPAINALSANKFWIFFYGTNDYAPMLFKNVVPWDDTKFDYRSGYPENSAKTPKRRESLMTAIEAADIDGKLPLEERALGAMRPIEIVQKVEKKAKISTEKKSNAKPQKQTKKKALKKLKESVEDKEDEEKEQEEEEQEDLEEKDMKSSLTKDEIKAKVANRKAPSKKASKGPKASDQKKPSSGKSNKNLESFTVAVELDLKRKKEIELLVPRQSIKSSDVKQMTEEDMKKQMGRIAQKVRDDEKDKIEYKVGCLATFAKKLTCLFSYESTENNIQVMAMLKELFQEKIVYRSDVERSGLAAIVAALRKSTNPSVAQTASALRRHLMKNLKDDTLKKTKGSKDSSDREEGTVQEQQQEQEKEQKQSKIATSATPKSTKKEDGETSLMQQLEPTPSTAAAPTAQKQPSEIKAPVKSQVTKEIPEKEVVLLEPARKASREMFEQVLKENGKKGEYEKKATELEVNLFERFKTISDEYMTQVRLVTFGLRGDKSMCERILTDKIKTLEFAYANHSFFKS